MFFIVVIQRMIQTELAADQATDSTSASTSTALRSARNGLGKVGGVMGGARFIISYTFYSNIYDSFPPLEFIPSSWFLFATL